NIEKNQKEKNNEGRNVKFIAQRNFNTKNTFSVLAKYVDENTTNEEQGIRVNIDVAFEIGVPIDEEEAQKWPQDLQEYYRDKYARMENGDKRKLLLNKIRILEEDVRSRRDNIKAKCQKLANEGVVYEMENSGNTRSQAYGVVYDKAYRNELAMIQDLIVKRQCTEVEVFMLSNLPLTDTVRETWTDEMFEYYQGKVVKSGQNRNTINKGIILEGTMHDEVGCDGSAWNMCVVVETRLKKKMVNKACENVFRLWNWVSNATDCNKGCRLAVGWDNNVIDANLLASHDQVMHFEVRIINDKRKFFISFIYRENEPKNRLKLWEYLSDHMKVVDNHPWVIMGDFNVIMYADEHSKGSIDNYHGVKEFRGCMEHLNMEDLAMNGFFLTWVQKIKDPENGIMKKLDKIMGNNEFLDQFGSCYATFLSYITSDHCPGLLTIPDVAVKRKKSFRFMNFLADKKEFHQLVRENWNEPINGYAMFVLVKRLKGMKKHLI
ncbi:RNA-directed DNA polymerase, eukaryota, reverse transcriptase zinc-binding domain protein, partial [Tanacetum coccineum]